VGLPGRADPARDALDDDDTDVEREAHAERDEPQHDDEAEHDVLQGDPLVYRSLCPVFRRNEMA
jgi:hypothetical protein